MCWLCVCMFAKLVCVCVCMPGVFGDVSMLLYIVFLWFVRVVAMCT